MGTWSWRFGTFVTGFVAGSAPFAAMAVLPAVLNPGTEMGATNWWALLGLAALVGLVAVIVFERSEQTPRPRDVFMVALGIPTMFIGTVSNMNARFDAARTVDRANFALEREGEIGPGPSGLEILKIDPNSGSSWMPSLVDEALAQTSPPSARRTTGSGYLIVIGTFRDQSLATTVMRRMQGKGLRTERYAQKALSIYRAADGTYYLTYARAATRTEAQRIYRLLLINDPQLAPRILELRP